MIRVTGKLPEFFQEWADYCPPPRSWLEIVCVAISDGKPVFSVSLQRIGLIDEGQPIWLEGTVDEMSPLYNAVQHVNTRLSNLELAVKQSNLLEENYGETGPIYFQHILAIKALMVGAKTPVEGEEEVRSIVRDLTFRQSLAMVRLTTEGMKIAEAVDLAKRHATLLNTDGLVLMAGKIADGFGLSHTDMLKSLFEIVDQQLFPPELDLRLLPYIVALSKTELRPPRDINMVLSKAGIPPDNEDLTLLAKGMMSVGGWSLTNFLKVVKFVKSKMPL